MRNLILILHRWIALATGLFLFLIALSGALLVLEEPLDHHLNARLWQAPAPRQDAAMLSLDTLIAHAATAAGGPIGGLLMPSGPDLALVANGPRGAEVFVNPYTGTVNGVRSTEERNRSLVRVARRLHEQLLTGSTGNDVVGVTTAAAFLLILGGIILWWKDRTWRVALSASWKRISFDLHHLLGIAAALILLVVTGTGIWMQYPAVANVVRQLDRTPPPDPRPQPAAPVGTPTLSLDAAVRIATDTLPGAVVRMVSAPADPKQPFMVALHFPEDRTPGGRSRITLDRFSGAILGRRSTREASTISRLTYIQRSLHTGNIFGTPSAALWLVACLALAAQPVTGFIMWWSGRPARKAAKARVTQARAQANRTSGGRPSSR